LGTVGRQVLNQAAQPALVHLPVRLLVAVEHLMPVVVPQRGARVVLDQEVILMRQLLLEVPEVREPVGPVDLLLRNFIICTGLVEFHHRERPVLPEQNTAEVVEAVQGRFQHLLLGELAHRA
jgi:hypothetical protein